MAEKGKTGIVAVTGGIAGGKSTVGEILSRRGLPVIDSDRIAHEITTPGSPALGEIVEVFGREILTADGALDRAKMGGIVFADKGKRRALEEILHPRIGAEWRRRANESGAPWVFVLIPLLFEAHLEDTVDVIWLCYAPREVRLQRAIERDGARREDVIARITAQMPDEEKRARADVVLDTTAPLEELERQVDRALSDLEGREVG